MKGIFKFLIALGIALILDLILTIILLVAFPSLNPLMIFGAGFLVCLILVCYLYTEYLD
ncbi:MAG: hypothetical protein KAW66_11240 [Candidatus Lokiarchaeota archaeon]|nr:hypothetical protein [Candidatus Lokiarchaeota archaeon]